MKKTVSTAIGGVVFHIEEDAYERLSAYLESVQRYFSAFSEGREIIQDIEARIAELLLVRLKGEEREAITAEDVAAVTATMGTVADFAAAEQDEVYAGNTSTTEGEPAASTYYQSTTWGQNYAPGAGAQTEGAYTAPEPGNTSWFRARRDRVMAGVLGGIAAKAGIDALWLRVAFVLFFFGFSFLPAFPVSMFIVYVVLAFIMPTNAVDEEPGNIRKLYREPKGEVMGGVAGGLASYLGMDVTLVRVVLVLLGFAWGAGILLYLLLWLLTPVAQTMADRMRMRGEPITLSSFNERISSFTKAEPGKRNLLERILLLPFELAGMVLRALWPVVKGLVRVIGALVGLIILFIAFAFIVAGIGAIVQVATTGTLGGEFIHFDIDHTDPAPAYFWAYVQAAPAVILYAASAAVLFFGLLSLMGALSLIAAKRIGNRYVNGTLLGLTVLSIVVAVLLIPQARRRLGTEARQETTTYYPVPAQGVFTVAVPEVAAEYRFPDQNVTLSLQQADGDTIRLVQAIEGSGADRAQALEAASEAGYSTRFADDTLLSLAPGLTMPEGRPYRLQRATLTLRVPEGKPFRLTHDAADMAEGDLQGINDSYSFSDFADRLLVFRRGKLTCLDCVVRVDEADDENDEDDESEDFQPRIDISTDSTRLHGEVEDVTINRHGIETIVRDEKTGRRMRVHIGDDSITRLDPDPAPPKVGRQKQE